MKYIFILILNIFIMKKYLLFFCLATQMVLGQSMNSKDHNVNKSYNPSDPPIWSQVFEFQTDKQSYIVGQPINLFHVYAPYYDYGHPLFRMYTYAAGQIPDSTTPVIAKAYISGYAGMVNFSGLPTGKYIIYFYPFETDYDSFGEPKIITIVSAAQLQPDKTIFSVGEPIKILYENILPNLEKDWVGIYKEEESPGSTITPARKEYLTTISGSVLFPELPPGKYYAQYFMDNTFTSNNGEKVFFEVKHTIDNAEKKIVISPNPVKQGESVFINLPQQDEYELNIAHVEGRLPAKILTIKGGRTNISTFNMKNGIYFYKARSIRTNETFSGKLIIE